MRLSVTEYATQLGVTRQAVLLQIKEKTLFSVFFYIVLKKNNT